MFIYETRNIFSEDGEGPLRGLVIKATPADFFPALEGESVIFLEENEEGISVEESFQLGSEPEEGEKAPQKADTPEELIEDITNAEDGAVIKLTSDMAVEESISIPQGKSITIDLGGKEMSGANVLFVDGGELTLKNGTVDATSGDAVTVRNGGKLIIDGAELVSDGKNGASAREATIVMNSGSITSQEAGILGLKDSNIEINGGEITGIDNGPVMGNGSKSGQNQGTNMNVVMNGGKLIAHIQSSGYIACGVYVPNSGSFTMNGGEIISDGCGICQRGGTVNLLGGSIKANGASEVLGKVGDSRIVVGPYAVVYDAQSKYPDAANMELHIGANMQLESTDGADNEYKYVDVLLGEGFEVNITDDRK